MSVALEVAVAAVVAVAGVALAVADGAAAAIAVAIEEAGAVIAYPTQVGAAWSWASIAARVSHSEGGGVAGVLSPGTCSCCCCLSRAEEASRGRYRYCWALLSDGMAAVAELPSADDVGCQDARVAGARACTGTAAEAAAAASCDTNASSSSSSEESVSHTNSPLAMVGKKSLWSSDDELASSASAAASALMVKRENWETFAALLNRLGKTIFTDRSDVVGRTTLLSHVNNPHLQALWLLPDP